MPFNTALFDLHLAS